MMRKYFSNQNMVILAAAIFTTTALHTMEERVSDSSETDPFVTIMLFGMLGKSALEDHPRTNNIRRSLSKVSPATSVIRPIRKFLCLPDLKGLSGRMIEINY